MKFTTFNIPNRITILRVILIPVFAYFLIAEPYDAKYVTAIIFLLLSASDLFDGYLARKTKQETKLGKLLDPIADKILIISALILLIEKRVPAWMAVAIIAREVLITAIRIYLVPKGTVIVASYLGKLKTLSQIIAIFLVIINAPFSEISLLIATLITILSGIDYLIQVKKLANNEIINIPNAITFIRFMLVPFLIYSIIKYKTSLAIMIFAAIALTDKLDGLSARMMKQFTEFGSGFDSFTDWLFIISTFLAFVSIGRIKFLWAFLLIIAGIISGISKIIYSENKKTIPTTAISKVAAAFIYGALFSFLIDFEFKAIILAVAVLLTYISMIVYAAKAINCIR